MADNQSYCSDTGFQGSFSAITAVQPLTLERLQ